jgi:hypothetical protein
MSAETTSGASSVPYTNTFLTTMLAIILAMFAGLLACLLVGNPQATILPQPFILEKNNLGSYTLILLVLKIIDILQVESQ